MSRVVSRRDLFTLGSPGGEAAPSVHIASLLVQAVPEYLDSARAVLAGIPGAEVHATAHPCKFVAVLESADEGTIARCVNDLHGAPGVLTVSIVSHLVESADALAEDVHDGRESSSVSQN